MTLIQRSIISLLAVSLFCTFQFENLFAASKDQNVRPNVLFILMDDLGQRDLGVYGSSLYETPNIDKLASQGVRFNNAYVAFPRCVPSRVAYFSGQHPARFGQPGFPVEKGNALPLSAVTFGEHFQKGGYHTGYIGKWHLGHHEDGFPKNQGFDENIVAGAAGAPNSYFYPYNKARKGKSKEAFPKDFKGKDGDYLNDYLTDRAEDFLDRNKEKPFLLVMAHYAVHTPIEAKKSHIDHYSKKLESMKIKPAIEGRSVYDVKPSSWGEQKTIQNNPVYAGMVHSSDESIGRLMAKLEALDLDKNTIVIFTSDHGGLSSRSREKKRELATTNLPLRMGKGWPYEGGVKVPLIVKYHDHYKAGLVSDAIVSSTDHYATLLEMCGLSLSPKDHKDGYSYFAALNEKHYKREVSLFWHEPTARPTSTGEHNYSAILDGKWKLIHWFDDGAYELYNLKRDPGEEKNLIDLKPEMANELKVKLEAWKKEVNARTKKTRKKKK